MVPQPKRKHSKGRRDRRRAQDNLQTVSIVQCSHCGEMRPSHTVCPNCGHYQGRE
ncbi:MAG TPA: 50S ribosomal protein L32, partial [Anaerolineaceae bacterium]|nr:50S ribosomal protein L32 [Anaerolineaceae bacterium]